MTEYVPLSDDERRALITAARSLLGTPWKHQGRTTRGTDCIGYVGMAMAMVRQIPPPPIGYGRQPTQRRLRAGLVERFGEPVKRDPIPADLVTIKWGKHGEERHLALVTDHPSYGIGLIHADNTACGGGRVVEHGVDAWWRSRIVEVWAL